MPQPHDDASCQATTAVTTKSFRPTNGSNRRPAEAPLIVLASAIPEVRRRWRRGLHEIGTIQEVFDGTTLKRNLEVQRAAVLLLDLALPRLGAFVGVNTLRQLSPPTKIIVFSAVPRASEAIAALKAGARGYCGRDIDSALLAKAVDKVQRGEFWVGRMVIPHLLNELTSLTEGRPPGSSITPDARFQDLTVREREVAQLVSGGAPNKEIAGKLNITERTVKAHLTAVFRKLGRPDRLRVALFVRDKEASDAATLGRNSPPPPWAGVSGVYRTKVQ